MARVTSIGIALAGSALLTITALAQSAAPASAQSQMGQHSSMASMMGQMNKLKAAVARARASNDPVKMRAALTEVQSYLSRMEMHKSKSMKGCMNMGSGQRGMMSPSETNPGAPPPKGR